MSHMKITKGKANRELVCETCKKAIAAGECCVSIPYRERAVSYREAMHAGSMTVTRHRRYHAACSPKHRNAIAASEIHRERGAGTPDPWR